MTPEQLRLLKQQATNEAPWPVSPLSLVPGTKQIELIRLAPTLADLVIEMAEVLLKDYPATEHHERCGVRQAKQCDCYMQRRGYRALASLAEVEA